MNTNLIEAGATLAVTALIIAAGVAYLLWVRRHRGDYPDRPGRTQ